MAIYTKRNGRYEEMSKRLAIKAPGQKGYLDYEDTLRLQQIAHMITNDIHQTLEARRIAEKSGKWREANPVLESIMREASPGIIRATGSAGIMALTNRWSNMENPVQRKAEMIAVAAAEMTALKYSVEHNMLAKNLIPKFMFTLWAKRF